jgi:surfeit locus 1 family protein
MRRDSLFWPTVFAAGALVVLLGLGTWQVERLHWKEALIADREAAMAAAPAPLPRTLDEARALDFHRVSASGTFLNDREFFVGAVDDVGHNGYQVVTPLRLDDGAVLLVNRGFVPEGRKDPASRAAGEPQGETTVSGILRLPPQGKPAWFVPDNSPERNYWFYVDVPAMARAGGLDRVLPFYVEADATPNPGGLPRGGQTRISLPNNHLQYAMTWYGLAIVLVVMYAVFVRRHRATDVVPSR